MQSPDWVNKYTTLGFEDSWAKDARVTYANSSEYLQSTSIILPDAFIRKDFSSILDELLSDTIRTNQVLFVMDLLDTFTSQLPSTDSGLYEFYTEALAHRDMSLPIAFPEFYTIVRRVQLLNIEALPIYQSLNRISNNNVELISTGSVWMVSRDCGQLVVSIEDVSSGQGGSITPEILTQPQMTIGDCTPFSEDSTQVCWRPLTYLSDAIKLS